MTSPTRAWTLCRLSDRARLSMPSSRINGLRMLRRNDCAVIHARAWLAATWLESGWLTPRSTTRYAVDPDWGDIPWETISLSPAQQRGMDQSRALLLEAAA